LKASVGSGAKFESNIGSPVKSIKRVIGAKGGKDREKEIGEEKESIKNRVGRLKGGGGG